MEFDTSDTEIRDLVKAWLAISFAFTIAYGGFSFSNPALFIVFAITVGTGFLLHELAHKFVAQRFGAVAEFRADNQMLWLAIALSFFGFIFAAPGAVMIASRVNRKQNGIIAISGSLVNLILAILFRFSDLLFSFSINGISVGTYGFFINSWLAFFNMLPFLNLDGLKVLSWNKFAWLAMIGIAGAFTFLF